MMLMLNVPATVGLIVLAQPIVALLLERGRFTSADTAATAAALIFYAPGLIGYSAVKIASPSFYAMRDSRTPVMISILAVAANLAINLMLVRVMGYRGLALGTSIAAMLNAGALLWLLRGRLEGLEGRRVAISFIKIAVASAAMGLAAFAASAWLAGVMPARTIPWKALQVFGAMGVAVAVLGLAAKLLRIGEFEDAVRRVLRRLVR